MRPAAAFLVPGRLETPTGGSVYDRRMVVGLRSQGWDVAVRELDDSFPAPTPHALDGATAALAAIPDDTTTVIDGLAYGAMPDVVERHASRLRLVALMHLPIAHEIGIAAKMRRQRERDERRALRRADLIIVTGPGTQRIIESFGIDAEKIALVEPGVDPAPIARGSAGSQVELLCVATVNAGKGHDLLVRALDRIRGDRWHLTCVGSLTRDASTASALRRTIEERALADRIELTGALDDVSLKPRFDSADLFVLATRFETYGMAVAEALSHGLPVVSTSTGAIPALVGEDAGLIVEPDDERALAAALQRVIGDASLRLRLRDGACRARRRMAPWSSATARFAAALQQVASRV